MPAATSGTKQNPGSHNLDFGPTSARRRPLKKTGSHKIDLLKDRWEKIEQAFRSGNMSLKKGQQFPRKTNNIS